MWCGAIWFRDIFNIKEKNPRKGEKNETDCHIECNRAILLSQKQQREKKSEIEITFLNSHFVNWREVNKQRREEKKNESE